MTTCDFSAFFGADKQDIGEKMYHNNTFSDEKMYSNNTNSSESLISDKKKYNILFSVAV